MIVDALLDDPRIDVTAQTSDGCTALSLAATMGHGEMLQILLRDPRLDVNAGNHVRETCAASYLHSQWIGRAGLANDARVYA